MSAPERIWVDDDGYWFDIDPSETRPEYICKEASDAAIAAARAEGVREGMLKAAEIAAQETEAPQQYNIKDQWRAGIGTEVAAAIRAAAEAQP